MYFMKRNTIIVATMAALTLGSITQSCASLASSNVGLSILKKILIGGVNKGVSIFKDKDAFLQSDLIDKALPKNLKNINSVLEKVNPSLVAKEKDYIAQAASYTVGVSEPILKDAINNLTTQDVTRIVNGEAGTATQILKEKSSDKLVQAILPKVDEKLNEYGIAKSINTALKGNSLLSSILGSNKSTNVTEGGLSQLASEQLVNGLFNIIEDYEKQHSTELLNAIK